MDQLTEPTKRCVATPRWSVSVPCHFEETNNGDSWQAFADSRCVYVSSMKVGGGAKEATAAVLCASAAKRIGTSPPAARLRFAELDLIGEAELKNPEQGFELRGVMCVDGGVATCVISFSEQRDRDWAIGTWQSLRPLEEEKPWWKFW
jgi:hypothetical protein